VRTLPRAGPEGLGRKTIMDRALAGRHGAAYVHLAAFAIDVDRVRDATEGSADERPFGWEVFLTECWLVDRVSPADPVARGMIEDVVLAAIDASGAAGEEGVLGAQVPFAVWDAVARGAWPAELRSAFSQWKARPKELVKDLAPLWKDEARHRRELATACLEAELDPPLAPPTLEALRAMAG
jgi:hypothetical protein